MMLIHTYRNKLIKTYIMILNECSMDAKNICSVGVTFIYTKTGIEGVDESSIRVCVRQKNVILNMHY